MPAAERAAPAAVVAARVDRYQTPLRTPYHLAFTTLTAFDTVRVELDFEDGSHGLAEVVALPGYGDETADDVERVCRDLASPGQADGLRADAEAAATTAPMAASAIGTALEWPALLAAAPAAHAVVVNHALSAESLARAGATPIEAAVRAGARALKIKVGRSIDDDLAAAAVALAPDGPSLPVVFDANQGHSVADAIRFAAALRRSPVARLAWYEQPVDRRDWDAMAAVCGNSGVPIVLDEAILSAADVARAADLGAHGVKLKLVKHPGPSAALEVAGAARARGLRVVFGNGVATALGNAAELLVMAAGGRMFSGAAECTGFAKLISPRPFEGGRVDAADGEVRWTRG